MPDNDLLKVLILVTIHDLGLAWRGTIFVVCLRVHDVLLGDSVLIDVLILGLIVSRMLSEMIRSVGA